MKFGLSQLLNPTPDTAKKIFKTIFIITSIAALALQSFPQIPQHINDVVNQWTVSINTFVFALTRLFGVDAGQPSK